MSYILDALKKSERERAGADRRLPGAPETSPRSGLPRQGWPLALGSGLVAGAVVAVIVIWRGAAHEPASEPVRRVDSPPPAEAIAAVPSPLPLASVAELPPVREAVRAPASGVPTKPAVPSVAPVAPTPPPTMTQNTVSTTVPMAGGDAPFLRQMSAEFQRQVPELAVTIHVYSSDESQRILFLNNREYRRGDQVQEGLRVEDITSDGALLSYRGERFKLRRPY